MEEKNNLDKGAQEEVLEEAVDSVEEDLASQENLATEEASESRKGEKPSFLQRFQSTLIDQIFVGALSLILLYIFDGIIGLLGFRVSDKLGMYLVAYVLLSIIYPPIIESTKFGNTIGKKASDIITVRMK
ncbi:RDD family protein [Desnuesiella massiliensis]|uniref:RDD family protein n=1 Tax=Desnuesiella massiliensis TaxID=1650662 RepID=UPI0006E451FD|nr:RDD family protein [Desnuesiella massiliensis]